MKPILGIINSATIQYQSELGDAISMVVEEELNGRYEAKMTYHVDGNHASEINVGMYIFAKPNDDDAVQAFHIYKISKPINGIFTVYAEHVSYIMSGFPVKSFSLSSATAQEALDAINSNKIISYNINFSTDVSRTRQFSVTHPKSMRGCLLGEQDSMRQVYGGDWKFDNFNATLLSHRGKTDSSASIMYGKNMTGITYVDSIENVYSGVTPYWFGNIDGTDTLIELTSDRIVYPSSGVQLNPVKILIVDMTDKFNAPPTEAQLRTAAQSYIEQNDVGKPDISINVSFAPLWQAKELSYLEVIEKVSLGDEVSVVATHIGVATEARVVKTTYDVILERYNSIEIGTVKKNLVGKLNGNIAGLQYAIKQLQRKKGG